MIKEFLSIRTLSCSPAASTRVLSARSFPERHPRLPAPRAITMSILDRPVEDAAWYFAISPTKFGVTVCINPMRGPDAEDVEHRLHRVAPTRCPPEPPPSKSVVARGQLADPMNIILLIVGVASFSSGRWQRVPLIITTSSRSTS